MSSSELVRYDAMCRAIAEAHEIDEVKAIRDQAVALETYARQAMNYEAERQCREIRVRAERECGARLKETPKAKGSDYGGRTTLDGRRELPSNPPKTLTDYGITKDQSSDWQRLADVPAEVFERELKTQYEPSAATIVHAYAPRTTPAVIPVASDALWLWGRLRDFERDGLLGKSQSDVLATMTEPMRADVFRLAPLVWGWLSKIAEMEDA